ncbi:phage tail assembly protein [Cupriavidus metallidurans]|uniref:phage tail assembly protein n=1 Tax=Cupriavidus metallidurans TaxID=119219 RepID=UPI001CCD9D0B|nr:phage tail assembly protein [Cupriavidus metallidurans]UBM11723.1 phage tail assembly protein [Cupriavidus metallidurans]
MTKVTTANITLETPITRGTEQITAVAVRKPESGELRGCSLVDLIRMEVTALHTVLPRITMPTLTQHEVARLDPADLMQFATTVTDFLLPRSVKGEDSQTESKTPSPTLQ